MTEEEKKESAEEKKVVVSTKANLSVYCHYWVTPHLRYAKKHISTDGQSALKWELRIQQMWQGSDGSQKWEWVEVVE